MGAVLIGTVESSYRVLETLIDIHTPILAVLSLAPEDSAGISDYADLRPLAERHGITHRYIKHVNAQSVVAYLSDLKPDVIFVIGLSQLVHKAILRIPRLGCVGAHPALLPHNRGRAVIPWTLINDEKVAGMTLFYIDEGADSGDIIAQEHIPISNIDTAQTVYLRAVEALCQMLRAHTAAILSGTAKRFPQNELEASFCAKRGPQDGYINWNDSTRQIFNLVRAVTRPYPGAFTYYGDRKITVWAASPGAETWSGTPGQVLRSDLEQGVLVKTGDGTIWITESACEGNLEPPASLLPRVGERLGVPSLEQIIQRMARLEERVRELEETKKRESLDHRRTS